MKHRKHATSLDALVATLVGEDDLRAMTDIDALDDAPEEDDLDRGPAPGDGGEGDAALDDGGAGDQGDDQGDGSDQGDQGDPGDDGGDQGGGGYAPSSAAPPPAQDDPLVAEPAPDAQNVDWGDGSDAGSSGGDGSDPFGGGGGDGGGGGSSGGGSAGGAGTTTAPPPPTSGDGRDTGVTDNLDQATQDANTAADEAAAEMNAMQGGSSVMAGDNVRNATLGCDVLGAISNVKVQPKVNVQQVSHQQSQVNLQAQAAAAAKVAALKAAAEATAKAKAKADAEALQRAKAEAEAASLAKSKAEALKAAAAAAAKQKQGENDLAAQAKAEALKKAAEEASKKHDADLAAAKAKADALEAAAAAAAAKAKADAEKSKSNLVEVKPLPTTTTKTDVSKTKTDVTKKVAPKDLSQAKAKAEKAKSAGQKAIALGKKKGGVAGAKAVAAGERAVVASKALLASISATKVHGDVVHGDVLGYAAPDVVGEGVAAKIASLIARGAPKAKAKPSLKSEVSGVADDKWTRFCEAMKVQGAGDVDGSNALGMFAMKPRRLADFGIVKNVSCVKAPNGRAVWTGEFAPPMTAKKFLSNKATQYEMFCRSMRDYVAKIKSGEIKPPDGGCPKDMTLSGILAVLHRAGPSGLKHWGDEAKRFNDTNSLYLKANGIF